MEFATLSVSRIDPKPLNGLRALMLTPGLAATTAVVGWLMSDSRCKCKPRRPTYPTLSCDFQKSSRSTVKFHAHASGLLNALLCVVTTKGMLAAPPAPGLSTVPNDTLAFGWKGGFPPRKTESLTPRRVKKRAPPARTTVLSLIW